MERYRFTAFVPGLIFIAILLTAWNEGVPAQVTNGVRIDPAVVTNWEDMKSKDEPRYTALKLSDDSKFLIVERTSAPNASYDDLLGSLPRDTPRFYLVNFKVEANNGETRFKHLLVVWLPEMAPAKWKMVYAATTPTLKAALPGIDLEVQGTESSDIAHDTVMQMTSR